MDIFTHRFIADFLSNGLKELIEQERRAFLIGNIAPDISLTMKKTPHNIKGSAQFFKNLLERIVNFNLAEYEQRSKFFFNLGIANHFICDYFCAPHNDSEKFKNYLIHYRYENELRKFIRKNINLFMENMDDIDCSLNNISLIIEYINTHHHKYLNDGVSMKNDICFSLNVCFTFIINIVNIATSVTFEIDRLALLSNYNI